MKNQPFSGDDISNRTIEQSVDLPLTVYSSSKESSIVSVLLEKIKGTNNVDELGEYTNLFLKCKANEEQERQNGYARIMIVVFFITSFVMMTAGVVIEAPIFIGAGLFLLGASAFSIVPDYVSKLTDKLNTPGVFSKIPSKGDDKPNTGDKDKDS